MSGDCFNEFAPGVCCGCPTSETTLAAGFTDEGGKTFLANFIIAENSRVDLSELLPASYFNNFDNEINLTILGDSGEVATVNLYVEDAEAVGSKWRRYLSSSGTFGAIRHYESPLLDNATDPVDWGAVQFRFQFRDEVLEFQTGTRDDVETYQWFPIYDSAGTYSPLHYRIEYVTADTIDPSTLSHSQTGIAHAADGKNADCPDPPCTVIVPYAHPEFNVTALSLPGATFAASPTEVQRSGCNSVILLECNADLETGTIEYEYRQTTEDATYVPPQYEMYIQSESVMTGSPPATVEHCCEEYFSPGSYDVIDYSTSGFPASEWLGKFSFSANVIALSHFDCDTGVIAPSGRNATPINWGDDIRTHGPVLSEVFNLVDYDLGSCFNALVVIEVKEHCDGALSSDTFPLPSTPLEITCVSGADHGDGLVFNTDDSVIGQAFEPEYEAEFTAAQQTNVATVLGAGDEYWYRVGSDHYRITPSGQEPPVSSSGFSDTVVVWVELSVSALQADLSFAPYPPTYDDPDWHFTIQASTAMFNGDCRVAGGAGLEPPNIPPPAQQPWDPTLDIGNPDKNVTVGDLATLDSTQPPCPGALQVSNSSSTRKTYWLTRTFSSSVVATVETQPGLFNDVVAEYGQLSDAWDGFFTLDDVSQSYDMGYGYHELTQCSPWQYVTIGGYKWRRVVERWEGENLPTLTFTPADDDWQLPDPPASSATYLNKIEFTITPRPGIVKDLVEFRWKHATIDMTALSLTIGP